MPNPCVLIVDDHATANEALCLILKDVGLLATGVHSAESALEQLAQEPFDVVLTDLQLPGMDGLELLIRLRERQPDLEVIVFTAYATIETAVQAIKGGAFDFITKPVNPIELEHTIRAALERQRLKRELERLSQENEQLRAGPEGQLAAPIGRSLAMRSVMETVELVAQGDSTVLIRGESGTGKELIARAIHERSPRATRPFVRVNSAALAEGLLESELFGHERGAFTGAVRRKLGKFELAADGTLFLDEIGDISAGAQAKLLRALQEREFERVGGHELLKVQCRIIAATNQPLEERVSGGGFRQDLFYRLNVVPVQLPPLRKRKEDIPELVGAFLQRFNQRFRRQVPALTPEGLARFMAYDWPGNIRELENLVERGVVLGSLESQARGLPVGEVQGGHPELAGFKPGGELGLAEYLDRLERDIIVDVLRRAQNNRTQAASLLGIDRNLLRYKLQKYKLNV